MWISHRRTPVLRAARLQRRLIDSSSQLASLDKLCQFLPRQVEAKHSSVNSKAVIPRERSERDVDEAIEYYLSENAPEAALGFIDASERAYNHIPDFLCGADGSH
jgi:hypothetical protein